MSETESIFNRRGTFLVTAGGAGVPSPITGRDASYWDWGFSRYAEHGALKSYTRGGQHNGPVTLLMDGREIAFRLNQLRLYVSPVFRQPLARVEGELAPAVIAWLDRSDRTPDEASVVEEYVLEMGTRFNAVVRRDRYRLPPFGGFRPRRATNPILHLSDRPFDELPSDEEPIPAFRGLVY